MISRLVVATGSLFVLSGCVTLTTAQTARTLKPGQSGGHIGVAAIETNTESASEVTKTTETQRQTGVVAGMRYGLFDGFEIGARATTMGLAMVDLKLGLVQGGGPFEMALGLGQGYAEFTAKSKTEYDTTTPIDPDETETRYQMRITDVPLYFSLDFDVFALYAVPRYVYVHEESKGAVLTDGSDDTETEKSSSRSLAVTAGFMLGGSAGLFAEYTVIDALDKEKEEESDEPASPLDSKETKSTTSNVAVGVYFGR